MPSVGVESGPEIVSKSLAPHSGVVGIGASETNVMKDREKRRHRDGPSSKGYYSKKLKEPVSCPSSGGVDSLSENDMGSFPQIMRVNVEVFGMVVGNGLPVCKSFVDKFVLLCSCP